MKKSAKGSLGEGLKQKVRRKVPSEEIRIHETVRSMRLERELSGVGLCQKAGDLDPKTLTALEKGRIKNPSIKTLQSVARGLGVTVSDLFRHSEMALDHNFYQGTQKGAFQIDFSKGGLKIVSFTPFIQDFFCGKIIFGSKKTLNEKLLKHAFPVYVSTIFGRFDVTVEHRKITLKEGENLFFNGNLRHSFTNPLQRESVLLMVTAPSFL